MKRPDVKCETCPAFDPYPEDLCMRDVKDDGICRMGSAEARMLLEDTEDAARSEKSSMVPYWPEMRGTVDWCCEHPVMAAYIEWLVSEYYTYLSDHAYCDGAEDALKGLVP